MLNEEICKLRDKLIAKYYNKSKKREKELNKK